MRSLDALKYVAGEREGWNGTEEWRTISTNNKSSNIIASWTCNGTPSRDSVWPFSFLRIGCNRAATREFKGARTKDASAINDGSPAKTTVEPRVRRESSAQRKKGKTPHTWGVMIGCTSSVRIFIFIFLVQIVADTASSRASDACNGSSDLLRGVRRVESPLIGFKTFEYCLCDNRRCDLRDVGVKGAVIVASCVQGASHRG